MKRLIGVVLVMTVLVLAGIGLKWGYDQVFVNADTWYAQVDGSHMSAAGENGNDFDVHYELPAVDADGNAQTLGFDSSRELREGAYLKLETLALRGVVSWEEVQQKDIPAAAWDVLANS